MVAATMAVAEGMRDNAWLDRGACRNGIIGCEQGEHRPYGNGAAR